jgi:small subunit ribosomal protein S16
MLTIRLSRVGKKKQASFKVIISEKAKDTLGTYLELLGHYNPHTNKAELKAERIKYWLGKGAQTSGTVHNLLVDQKIITGEKIKVANIKKKKEGEKTEAATPAKPADTPAPETPAASKPEEKPAETPAPAPEEKKSAQGESQPKADQPLAGANPSGGEKPKAPAEEKPAA